MSVVFNSFKQRFLNGEVPAEDTWTFVPVNKEFLAHFNANGSDYSLEQFRSVDDFRRHDSAGWDASYFEGIRTDYDWFKPHDTSGTNKPMFITSGVYNADGSMISASNWEDFQKTEFYKDVSGNHDIEKYLASGGFYYILKKDELRWFADRVNSGNNRIIGVFGDGVDGVIKGQIGKNEDYPFQGILDGNGHALEDVTVICDNDDNGLVGILGQDGVVKNFKISNTANEMSLVCEKQINLNHIKKDGRDINAALLVGRNYGKIENIDAHELCNFRFSGFVPQVYSVTNKSDDYEDFSTIRAKYDQGENYYFLNSWCINSPGNVCPYVGYFAEGLFAQSARGLDSEGSLTRNTIELLPALKSSYNPGICDVTLKLESKCSLVAFFVKAVGYYQNDKSSAGWGIYGNGKNYLPNGKQKTDQILYNQAADTEWGTNCVFLIAYDTKDEMGKDTRYFLEINGTAYDTKSGKGKRRYHFRAGHYNYKKHIRYVDTTTDPEVETGEDDSNSDYFSIGRMRVKYKAVYNNGGENDEVQVDPSDYEISDSDIKVYTADGVPAKIVSTEIEELFYAPRNFDTSSAVWDSMKWYAYLKKGIRKFTGSFTDDSGELVYVEVSFNNPVDHGISDDKYHGANVFGSFQEASCVKTWECVYTPAWANEFPSAINTTNLDVNGKLHATYKFYKTDKFDETTGERIYDSTLASKSWSSTEATNMQYAVETAIAEDLSSESSSNVFWEYAWWEQTGPKHYATKIIVDNQDKAAFQKYLSNRTDTWIPGGTIQHVEGVGDTDIGTYDGLHKYDITINSNDGIRAKGSIVMSLLRINDFQYRPFVHASDTDAIINGGVLTEGRGTIYPGARFGDVVAKFPSSASCLDYFADKAKAFAVNPNYYGMDMNGYWTTNCVRPDPENDPWRNRFKARESWISTLNFNWNLMRRMFDTENEHYQYMAEYDAVEDHEPWSYDSWIEWYSIFGMTFSAKHKGLDFTDKKYLLSDLPHALLNKPLRMNTMARAAYYISPIAGSNYGRIKNVVVSSERTNEGNFVGFVGGLAGKQERGVIDHCAVYARDRFKYFEGEPQKPDFNTLDATAFSAAMAEYDKACKNYNFRVRYKGTPIMPEAVSEAVLTLSTNPDDDWRQWEYYPQGSESRIDDEEFSSLTSFAEQKAYYKQKGITRYIETAGGEEAQYFEPYTENPDYKYEKGFYNAAAPIRAFTSAWYDDYDVTATNVMDDTVTYLLRPIFNAGGLFGKIVPTYNQSNIEITGTQISGTVCKNVNVHYILDDAVAETSVKDVGTLGHISKDIHDNFGAIAGLVELHTSEVCQTNKGSINNINLEDINVSAEGNSQLTITPFGFFAYQPNELPSMAATEGSPRQKGGIWDGEYTETTYALDLPIVIANYVGGSRRRQDYAPINQSSAAFFDFNVADYTDFKGHISGSHIMPYMSKVLNTVINAGNGVNINTSALAYCNPSALDIFKGSRGPQTLDGLFGSNTTFIPAMPISTDDLFKGQTYQREQLEVFNHTRSYVVGHDEINANAKFTMITNFSPINVDYLLDAEIFQKQPQPDIYFDYTYSSTSAFVKDWSFKHGVKFTSALDAKLAERGVKPSNSNIRMGYVFRDDQSHSADGFWYKNNYLHMGNSVSPKHIRTQLAYNDHLYTSGCAGYYYNEDGELVSATNNHVYDGMLVLDSNDRTVMYIDNNQGARVDGGSFNLQCSSVYYTSGLNTTNGGMLLEVK